MAMTKQWNIKCWPGGVIFLMSSLKNRMERMAKESERNVFQIYNWKEMVWWFMLSIPALGGTKANKALWFQGDLGLHGEILSQK